MKLSSAILTSLAAAPLALAWGDLGHQAIAYVAQDFLTPKTKTWVQAILNDKSASYLANAATWADTYKHTESGSFSAPLHFIDAQDSPPHACGVDYTRDCGAEGCVVSAIVDYTSVVQDTSASAESRTEAMKFLIHFVGDIHQPLHNEASHVGGNDIDVLFSGSNTNLHHMWDTNLPERAAGGAGLVNARKVATTLTSAIQSGQYTSQSASWIQGMNLAQSQNTAMSWAGESNAKVCSSGVFDGSVLKGVAAGAGLNGLVGLKVDLAGVYYNSAVPVVKEQFAKAGYRLAGWLNLIAEASA